MSKQKLIDSLDDITKKIDNKKLREYTKEFLLTVLPYPLLNYYIKRFINFVKEKENK